MRVLIVCSSGGHLTQALALKGMVGGARPQPGSRSPPRTRAPASPASRSSKRTTRRCGTCRTWCAQLRARTSRARPRRDPAPGVQHGAAIALPFFMQAHHYGATTVFLEPVDRITTASLSGRLVYPFADRFLVQWESLREIYPDADDIGVVL